LYLSIHYPRFIPPSAAEIIAPVGTGPTVSLGGSESGVNYQLKINGTNSGSVVAGTGAALSWTNQTTGGTYTIAATNATTTCANTMTGNVMVTQVPLPTAYTVGGGGNYCADTKRTARHIEQLKQGIVFINIV